MRIGSMAATAGLALIIGCGGSGRASGPPGGDDDPGPAPLDLSAISGSWSGWGDDSSGATLWLILQVERNPLRGGKAGSASVGVTSGVVECAAELVAQTAAPPRYTLEVRYPPGTDNCTGGTLSLEHDPQTDVLQADFTAEAGSYTSRHDLTRGSDPGPKP